jgi:DNA (cytosine-5)-methyltransferase 1
VLDLFSGIGGFSLGLERAGMTTVAFCEIDPFCRRVLAKHWPGMPIYDDVRDVTAARLGADGIAVDVICGGFPCQDISIAGKGAGLAGERSGLWREYARIVGELRPRYVIVENVAALLHRGLGDVLGDLAEIGYDAEWHCIPASAVGAPHQRDRIWVTAYANSVGHQEQVHVAGPGQQARDGKLQGRAADGVPAPEVTADADGWKRPLGRPAGRVGRLIESVPRNGDWPITHEPVLGRGTNGVPARLDRLRALGNAVVPQIPELIGRAILQAEAA